MSRCLSTVQPSIEVDGRLFEGVGKGYDGTQKYWLHGVFVGGLWAVGHLHPGGVGVTAGWREQLASIRPIIRYLVHAAARLVRRARQWRLDFAKTAFRLDWLYHAACQLE